MCSKLPTEKDDSVYLPIWGQIDRSSAILGTSGLVNRVALNLLESSDGYRVTEFTSQFD